MCLSGIISSPERVINMAKTVEQIEGRIRWVESRLEKVNGEIEAQLSQSFFKRDLRLCSYLDHEKARYTAMLNQLRWVLDE